MVERADTIDVLLRMRDLASKELEKFQDETRQTARVAQRSFSQINSNTRSLTRSLGGAVAAVGGIYAAIRGVQGTLRNGFGFLEAASAVEEANSKFEILFGEAAPRASAELDRMTVVLERSRGTLLNAAADFGGLLVPMGFAQEEAADLSLAITALANDLESFNNVPVDDVLRALRSGIIGQAEALFRFGIDVRETTVQQEALRLGLAETTQELSQQDKVLARLSIINRQTALAQGDVVRTADQYANQMRALRETIQGVRAEVGTQLIPVISEAITELGGAKRISEDFRAAASALSIVFVGLVRSAVKVIEAARIITTELGGTGSALNKIGDLVARVIPAFRILTAVGTFAFKTLSAAADVASLLVLGTIEGVLQGVNQATAALEALGNRAGLDLGIATNLTTGKDINQLQENASNASQRVRAAFDDMALSIGNAGEEFEETKLKFGAFIAALAGRQDLDDLRISAAEATGQFGNLELAARSASSGGIKDVGPASRQAAEGVGVLIQSMVNATLTAAEMAARFHAMPELMQGAAIAAAQYAKTLSDVQIGIDAFNELASAVEGGIARLSRDLVEGKANFSDFAKSLIKDIGAIITKFFLLRAIRGGLGIGSGGDLTGGGLLGFLNVTPNAKGGVMQGSMGPPLPLRTYASGGIANSPQVAVFGEGRGAEAFVPLPDGKSIPVSMQGGSGANVTINVTSLDPRSAKDVIMQNLDAIADGIATAIDGNSNRKLVQAVSRA